ncbi:MAG TPA: hypothetical protein VGI65_20970 [Steroidobacteraceae bacterium]|jgi:hypothetical protein
MGANGGLNIYLFVSQLAGETSTVCKELDLLDHPMRAMRMAFVLPQDSALGVASSHRDGDSFSTCAAGTDEVPCSRLCLGVVERTLEILAPESLAAAAREELDVVGGLLVGTKLIIGAPVFRQSADEQLIVVTTGRIGSATLESNVA